MADLKGTLSARPSSSPAPAAASARRSPCAPRPTAPTSPSRPRRRSPIRSCRGRSTRRPRRSRRRAAAPSRSRWTSATRSRSRRRSAKTVETFGGIDILINNASAINLTGTLETPMKRFDLMWGVNARGTFACSQACIPHLKKAANPHILTLSPPLNLDPKWFQHHVAYTMAKYGMSLCVLGMAEEFKAGRHRRQRPLAAHGDPHRRPRHAGRHHPAPELPQAGDRGRRRPRHPHPRQPRPTPATSSSTRTCCARPASPTSSSTRSRRGSRSTRTCSWGRRRRSISGGRDSLPGRPYPPDVLRSEASPPTPSPRVERGKTLGDRRNLQRRALPLHEVERDRG